MSIYFGNKCNVSICKIVLVCLLFCSTTGIYSQPKAAKDAEKKKELLEKEKEKEAIRKHNELLDKHLKMQGKKTQKRMKANKRRTDKYYKRKTGQTLWLKLFPKKKKSKKYKH